MSAQIFSLLKEVYWLLGLGEGYAIATRQPIALVIFRLDRPMSQLAVAIWACLLVGHRQ